MSDSMGIRLPENTRLRALRASGLLHHRAGGAFNAEVTLVRRTLGVPVAIVSLVEDDRQVFAGQQGLPEPWATRGETPLTHSFCQHVVAQEAPFFTGVNSVSLAPASSAGITLGEAVERMMTDPTRTHLGDTADAKYLQTFRAMKELLGADKPLASITRADCSAVKRLVAGLPANVKKLKAYTGCETLREVVALAATRGDKRISVGTVVVYVHALSAFFNWSISAGLLTVNPATRLAPRRSSEVSRRPFTVEEINQIVAGLGAWSKGGELFGRWWVPLIAAFTGMRLGEIVTFTVDDIGLRDGVECFILRKTADKSLKNDHSERIFPVHPELVRLGLLRHVAAVREKGGSRLFPDLLGDNQKHIGKLFQKRFGYGSRPDVERGLSVLRAIRGEVVRAFGLCSC